MELKILREREIDTDEINEKADAIEGWDYPAQHQEREVYALIESAEAEFRFHRLMAAKHADKLNARDRLLYDLKETKEATEIQPQAAFKAGRSLKARNEELVAEPNGVKGALQNSKLEVHDLLSTVHGHTKVPAAKYEVLNDLLDRF